MSDQKVRSNPHMISDSVEANKVAENVSKTNHGSLQTVFPNWSSILAMWQIDQHTA